MFRILLVAGCLALPAVAQADPAPNLAPDLAPKQPSQGHIMEARLLGLDPHLFTRTELAQIDAENLMRDRRERVRFILEMKERRGELPRGFAFGPEGQRIVMSVRPW
ncbi:hypothetical protein PE067_01960 [Paracoccus sp. DMF-8]|uniref:hypothetical protein n=1 Tax=Paracoccus sp. DMF-8 TaxID=3019445 RepID=UPI0023E8BD00|nr:hypothetical protein [Paracoccus sp. DMF-8]MDF3605031.1 hypothetical protein [Paracoccus sp. DMF-8]